MDVFISWTRADEDVKNVIVKKLQEAGITCWDSDLHCTSNFAKECIAAIKRSSVFIAIVSDASMAEGYVQNEITTARDQEKIGRLNLLVYKITEAPYTDEFEFLLNHISFVTGNLVQRVSSVSGASGIDTIVSRARELLRRRKEGDPEKPFDVHMPQIDGLKLTKTGYFVDGSRDALLLAMENALQQSNVLILAEFFGYGKRSTIKKFVERSGSRYTNAVMVHNEYSSLREFLTAGLDFTNVNENAFANLQPEALLRAKFKFLEKLDRQTLLVIPNVQFEACADTELCEMLAALKCHIILLTQESADAYTDWFPVIQVGRMRDEYLYELFFHHYARAYQEDKEALAEPLSRFFANIGGHTKTVELTAATLNRDLGVYPEDLPRYLSMRDTEGLQLKDRILRQIGSVFDADRLGADELTALLVAACLAVPYASEKNYRTVLQKCGVTDWHTVMELDKLRWLDVDIHNRTVSMEPVVAQIIFSKVPDAWQVLLCCLDHLMEQGKRTVSFSISDAGVIRVWNKLEYFFAVTGMPECAGIITQLRQNKLKAGAYDRRKMTEAIRRFEEKYPLCPSFETVSEEEAAPGSDREFFEMSVVEYIRAVIPHAKLIARNVEQLLFDVSAQSNRMMQNRMAEMSDGDLFEAVGWSGEEFAEILELCREEMQELDELEEDSVEFNITMECVAVINAFYQRDYLSVQAGVCNLLEHLGNLPPELFSEESFALIQMVFQMVNKLYFYAGAYHSVVKLCRNLLQLPFPMQQRVSVLFAYVSAVRKSGQYSAELYSAYEELLGGYDKAARDVFEQRADMFAEKKEILLMYAEDLAKGERVEDAVKRFAAARKLDGENLPDEEAACARCIVEVLVKIGGFRQAQAFVGEFYPPERIAGLSERDNAQTLKIMEEFAIYQSVGQMAENEFAENTDPKKHISYYQAFSRKNNSLLEQKYYNVADQTLDYDFSDLTAEEITQYAHRLRKRAQKEKMLRLAPEAFALASEAGYRVLGYRHHFVQYMGAAAMAEGKIAEILNGEGKTYTILLTAFLHSLYGRRVYVVDQSAYLTGRNYQWMHGVYDLLGISNTLLCQTKWDFKVTESVIYTDLQTVIFGYLNYEIQPYMKRGDFILDSVIIDEIDTALVDGADQEYVISSPEENRRFLLQTAQIWDFVKALPQTEEYYCVNKGQILLQPALYPRIEAFFRLSYTDLNRMSQLRQIENGIRKAILCRDHYELDKDYFIQNGVPVRENKTKGIFEAFEPQIGYFLCRENDLETQTVEYQLTKRSKTCNCISLRDFFRKFRSVCGTTATAVSFREEFREIYGLDYFCVPPHSPVIRQDLQSPVYTTLRAKEQAILELVQEKVSKKQPVLLIAQSTEESERYSRLLRRRRIEHKVLNARNAEAFSDIIVWAGVSGSVLVANVLAGRGADIKLGGNPELKTRQELVEMGEDITALDSFVYSLPTEQQKATPLYQKYHSILARNKALCAADRQVVVEAGGLCVIGTSFFPEPRTEQQTRGRSGRQGEVGESWVFRSLEDEELLPLFPPAYLSWVNEKLLEDGDVQELDAPILRKAIQNGQKSMHKAHFTSIRQRNNNAKYIDMARADFIGKRFDLQEGRLGVEDLLWEWVEDKTVLAQLQLLQKGEACNIPELEHLLRKYPGLKTVRGARASKALHDAIDAELRENLQGIDYAMSEGVTNFVCNMIRSNWEVYIEIVQSTVGQVNVNEQAVAKFLEEEKQRLIRKSAESLLHARKR